MALFSPSLRLKAPHYMKPETGMLDNEIVNISNNGALSSKKISVIIPLYNHACYIAATLESVLAQTSPVDEIILIDDGSSDNGFSVAQEVLAKTRNVTLLQQENADAYNTINRAISISQGDYLAVLNSDDLFTPQKIERCRRIINEIKDINLIAGDISYITDDGRKPKKAIKWIKEAYSFLGETGLPQLSLLYRNFVSTTSNMVFSRSLWESSGGFQPLRYCHDLDFLMFAHQNKKIFLDFGYCHVLYRQHKNNTIKENDQKVDIEIAAILAYTLKTYGTDLFTEALDAKSLKAFQKLLSYKKMSDLILFFITISDKFQNRTGLYKYATDPSRLTMLRNALG